MDLGEALDRRAGPLVVRRLRLALEFAARPSARSSSVDKSREIFGQELAYDAASFAQLDEILAAGWPDEPPALQTSLGPFGAYLGETIRRLHGGEWRASEDGQLELHGLAGGDVAPLRPFEMIRSCFERRSTFAEVGRSLSSTEAPPESPAPLE